MYVQTWQLSGDAISVLEALLHRQRVGPAVRAEPRPVDSLLHIRRRHDETSHL